MHKAGVQCTPEGRKEAQTGREENFCLNFSGFAFKYEFLFHHMYIKSSC